MLLTLPSVGPAWAQASPTCAFVLGFATLHGLIPSVVGGCVDNEQHNPSNGDALQHSAGGLLVWRKADNFTAFTDGSHSWVNGPNGVQERLNSQRFAWEANPEGLPVISPQPSSGADWPTYHHDQSRRGLASNTPPLSSVQSLWQSPGLDGQIYAEPLAVGSDIFVATENDSVYALDAGTGNVVWRSHLGSPVPAASLPCGDVDPVGITGTPVIDPGKGVLYAAAFVQPGQDLLFALDVTSGATLWQRSIDPSGADPAVQNQRGALALANGMVYVPFGGRDGDCGAYHGWVVGVPAGGSGALRAYRVPTVGGGGRSNGGGGIWAPAGVAADSSGNLFVATGNGGSVTFDYSDSVLKLSPSLQVSGYFAPSNWQALSLADLDLGSEAPVLLDNGLVFVVGKAGVGYLLRASSLGQIGGEAFSARVCSGGAFGASAYASPYLYVPCTGGVVALRVDSSGPSFSVAWSSPRFRAGSPIVAGGALWDLSRDGELYGLDPGNGQAHAQVSVGASATSFPSLAAAGGRLFVPAGTRVVAFVGS